MPLPGRRRRTAYASRLALLKPSFHSGTRITPGYSPENSLAIFIRGGELRLMNYCWRIYFKVLEVLFLASVSHAFLPSKQACGIHKFRHFCIRQQYQAHFPPEIGRSFSRYLLENTLVVVVEEQPHACLHAPRDGRDTCKAWRMRVCCASGPGRRVIVCVASSG